MPVKINYIKIENVKAFGKMEYAHMESDVSLVMAKWTGH